MVIVSQIFIIELLYVLGLQKFFTLLSKHCTLLLKRKDIKHTYRIKQGVEEEGGWKDCPQMRSDVPLK